MPRTEIGTAHFGAVEILPRILSLGSSNSKCGTNQPGTASPPSATVSGRQTR